MHSLSLLLKSMEGMSRPLLHHIFTTRRRPLHPWPHNVTSPARFPRQLHQLRRPLHYDKPPIRPPACNHRLTSRRRGSRTPLLLTAGDPDRSTTPLLAARSTAALPLLSMRSTAAPTLLAARSTIVASSLLSSTTSEVDPYELQLQQPRFHDTVTASVP